MGRLISSLALILFLCADSRGQLDPKSDREINERIQQGAAQDLADSFTKPLLDELKRLAEAQRPQPTHPANYVPVALLAAGIICVSVLLVLIVRKCRVR